MPLQRFLIAPETEGLVNAMLPWLLPDRAFFEMNNCYVWRQRIKKRFGSLWMERVNDPNLSRLRIQIGTIQANILNPALAPPTNAQMGGTYFIGQEFSVGSVLLTSWQAAGAMLSTNAAVATGTFNTANGTVTIAAPGIPDGTPVWFYPKLPGMGAYNYELDQANFAPSFVFDTRFSYEYVPGMNGFKRLGAFNPAGSTVWTGTDSDFFWGITWRNVNTAAPGDNINIFFVTNNVDPIRYWNDVTATWTDFVPQLNAGTTLTTCSLLAAFKGRLLAFDTTENATRFRNRLRYSWTQSLLGNVVNPQGVPEPAINNCFFEASGKGGYTDAPTSENITSIEFVKDRLIVKFEESTYQIVYTGSPDAPFIWQKIDNNFGAASKLGQVSLNNETIGFGANAIVTCNGAQVSRIDAKIPQEVFKIQNSSEQFARVSGVRDFYEEMIYWTFPANRVLFRFPSRILVYDYVGKTWSFNDDSFTVFGYFYQQEGLVWATWHTPWEDSNWTWNSGQDVRRYKNIMAINQQGYAVMIQSDCATNAPALSITDMAINTLAVKNHNLKVNDFIQILRCTGSTNLNNQIVKVIATPNEDIILIDTAADAGYTGGGLIRRVSRVDILTKQYNFFTNTGQNSSIPYIEFYVDNLGRGEDSADVSNPDVNRPRIRVDYFLSSSSQSMITQAVSSGAAFGANGGNYLEMFPLATIPFEEGQERFWRRVYFQAEGQTIQLRLYYDDDMMRNPEQSLVDFKLHAMLIYAQARGTRFRG